MQFPYYIVRFKLADARQKKKEEDSFHTTQYDLNDIASSDRVVPIIRFHTTQYDLNRDNIFDKHRGQRCFHTTQYDLNEISSWADIRRDIGFPYYIVRFKLVKPIDGVSIQQKFPYYIVRFKLAPAIIIFLLFICFHTTQYDLNSDFL